MELLLKNYSISEIILFLVVFAIAIKSIVTFFDWGVARLRLVFKKETAKDNDSAMIQELSKRQDYFEKALEKIGDKIDLLIQSDKDDIKSYITKEHHYFCYTQKWIDDYSLDCIEKRYRHYKEEGGNSFIESLMEELRNLSKQPPR